MTALALPCYSPSMSDKLFFGAAAIVAILMLTLALFWPQGGRVSGAEPAPRVSAESGA